MWSQLSLRRAYKHTTGNIIRFNGSALQSPYHSRAVEPLHFALTYIPSKGRIIPLLSFSTSFQASIPEVVLK